MRQYAKKLNGYLLLSIVYFFVSFVSLSPSPTFADESTSVTVPPSQTNFQFSFSSLDTATQFTQDQTTTYQITYGAKQSAGLPTTVTLMASYNDDQIGGIHVLDLVTSSISNAYNNTPGIVDLVNRKITWTFTLPQGVTDQTVSFKLKFNSNYSGSSTVPVVIGATMSNEYISFSEESVNQSYTYSPTSQNSTTTPTITPSPTPIQKPAPAISFSSVDFRSVTPTSITLAVVLSQDAQITAQFGLDKTTLPEELTTKTYATNHTLVLDNLKEDTTYYVQLTAKTPKGEEIRSDIYIFHTGKSSEIPQIDINSLTYAAQDILLYTNTSNLSAIVASNPVVVLPQGLAYTIRFKMSNRENVKRIQAILRNKNVLGITSSSTDDPSEESTDLVLSADGFYQGRLKSPSIVGLYEEFIRIYDIHGNIVEEKLADLHISTPFLIINAQTNKPIEHAQVELYYQNSQTHTFQILPPQLFPIKNPSFTTPSGQIELPLPAGVYKAKITAIGYAPKDVTFVLGAKATENYPTVKLTPQPFSLTTATTYYGTIALDTLDSAKQFVLDLSHSHRFFELNSLIITGLLVLLTFVAFVTRLHIPLLHLPSYFAHLLKKKQHVNTVYGRLVDEETQRPIVGATIYLLSMKTKKILNHTATNEQGGFSLLHAPEYDFAVEVLADGFGQTFFPYEKLHLTEQGDCVLTIKKRELPLSIGRKILQLTNNICAFFFEILLVLSLFFEVSLGYTLGWEKAAVFLVLSLANLFLWIFNLTQRRSFTIA